MSAVVWLVLLVMTVLGALASWLLKLAAGGAGVQALLRDGRFWAGGGSYGCAALLNIWVLRHADVSVVLPLTALTYVWTLVIGRWLLGERLTRRKIGGVGLILVGVALISLA